MLDPSAFKEDGGPSIAERIARGSGGKVWFRHADNTRVPARGAMGGWDQVRSRLVGDGDGRPMIVTFATCTDSIRTIPILQHDPDRPEDVMTDSEDHAWRRVELCLHVATVGADERGAEAGEHQRLPALPDGRAARGLVDVLRLRAF